MPYRRVKFRAGEYYHLYNRGSNYRPIFFERENYLYFLRHMRQYLPSTAIEVVAYCLMPNHYHLLVHLQTDNLSNLLQPMLVSYSKSINRRYARVGPLYQGPFKAVHVDRDEYLLHLSRYIHLNPAAAGLVPHAQDWEFSSYREFIGLRSGTLPRPAIILSQFASVEAYRLFVESYVSGDDQIITHLMLG
jgi:REP element-mobilizing transposase RayT